MIPDISAHDQELLEREGYFIQQQVGEGNTSRVYAAAYARGILRQSRMVKIPKRKEQIEQSDSVQTLINYHHCRSQNFALSEREFLATTAFQHPGLISLIDAFKGKDGIIIVYERFSSHSLQEQLESDGPLQLRQLTDVFYTTASALKYLHDQGYVHGDVKPSNILIADRDTPTFFTSKAFQEEQIISKLADLQNVRPLRSEKSALPIRGATPFSHPLLLNNFMGGAPTGYSFRDDLYAFSATMYYALTGSPPIDYRLVFSPEGKSCAIGNKEYTVALLREEKVINYIDSDDHDLEIAVKIDYLPTEVPCIIKYLLKKGLCTSGNLGIRETHAALLKLLVLVYGRQ